MCIAFFLIFRLHFKFVVHVPSVPLFLLFLILVFLAANSELDWQTISVSLCFVSPLTGVLSFAVEAGPPLQVHTGLHTGLQGCDDA